MSGEITAAVQAAGPDILWLIDEAGQEVTVRRPGQPDVVTRALLYQEDDEGEGSVAAPALKLPGWQGIFRPDVPLRDLPFTVLDAQGHQLVPDCPVQDPGEQGVVLIAHLLPLAERTRVSQLAFTVPGQGWRPDRNGNPVPAPGETLTVPARLSATRDPQVRDMVGADSAEVVLVGRWGSLDAPQGRPPGVAWGSTSPLSLDGQSGTLSVSLAYPDPDLWQEAQFGGRFVAVWRAT